MIQSSQSKFDPLVTLEKANRDIVFWKYALLVVPIVLIAVYASHNPNAKPGESSFDFSSLIQNILTGIIATLLLSVVYDFFTKKQQALQANIDRTKFINELSREVFLTRGTDVLTKDDLISLTSKLINDDRFLLSLADVTGKKSGFEANMLNAFFKPFWRTAVSNYSRWENTLVPDPSNPDGYLWESKQRFAQPYQRPIFRLAFSDSSTIGAKLQSCDVQFDSVLVFNTIDQLNPDKYPGRELSVRVTSKLEDGRRRTVKLSGKSQDNKVLGLNNFLTDLEIEHVIIHEFRMPDNISDDSVIEFDFTNQLSLNEPLFYVNADGFIFVEDIVIDYSEIRSKIKDVWSVSFIGNVGTNVDHDRALNRVVARVDGGLTCGQGLALIWTRV